VNAEKRKNVNILRAAELV